MSRADAERDGIEYQMHGHYYLVPCTNCGKKHKRRQYTGRDVYLCPACKQLKKRKEKAFAEKMELCIPDAETKDEKRFREAVEAIEKQLGSLDGYEKAIEVCRKASHKFGSIPEAMYAIGLVKAGYRIIPQQKIGRYHVDFCIPKEKLIIEVDGSPYHHDQRKELSREATINLTIGLDWRIIHIPANAVTKDLERSIVYIKSGTQGTT